MSASKPTATGQLSSTPFCELLVYALSEGLSGSLVLETPRHDKHAVLFAGGAPVKGRVAAVETRIGEVLSARGDVDAAARRAAAAGPDGELFGARLVTQGALDAAALQKGLEEQLLSQLAWLARLPGATLFGYYDNVDFLQSWGGERLKVDPLQAIWRAVDAGAPPDRVEGAVSGLATKTLRLHTSSRVARFAFPSRERAVVDVLRVKPQSFADLCATGLCDLPTLRRLVYALVVTRHLDVGQNPLGVQPGRRLVVTARARPVQQSAGERAPAEDAGAADPLEATREASAPAKPREERPRSTTKPSSSRRPRAQPSDAALSPQLVEAKLASLEDASHYDVLELSVDASAGQIASAFPALARRWHPDRLRPDQEGLREAVTRIFSRMTEASAVLSHVDSRQHYDQTLANALREDEEQEQVSRVLRAAEAFQKAEILLRKRDLAGAEQLARMAFEGDPEQPEYAALFAFVRSRREGCSEEERKPLLATLKDALGRQTQNVRIRYYYACVLKAAGEADKALRELRVVAEQDPSNLEAKRELRLHDMRKKNGPPATAAAGSGLFGRIFKR